MEEQLNSLAVTHLLQCTLRSLCIHENSQWVYAVFWRILPRNYPPPKWDSQGAYDRSRGNRRNWILVWEDGFCNFAASTSEINSGECPGSSVYANSEYQHYQGLQPELFFKMSHEIYNYGEGLIGKVAADHSHKWIYKEPNDQEINFLSAWHNSADSQPRTWEAQFQSGIKTIALIAVREGVIQLGAIHKVIEDLSYVVLLRKKFSYIESIPGVLLPHPSSSAYPFNNGGFEQQQPWIQQHYHHHQGGNNTLASSQMEYYHDHFNNNNQQQQQPMKITPSMSSLEALLSKLPSVIPVSSSSSPPAVAAAMAGNYCEAAAQAPPQYLLSLNNNNNNRVSDQVRTKEEYDDEEKDIVGNGVGDENGSSMSMSMAASSYRHHQQHYGYLHDLNVSSSMPNSGY